MSGSKPAPTSNAEESTAKNVVDVPALSQLVERLESKTDREFLRKVVKDAAELLGVDIAFISRFNERVTKMRSLVIYDRQNEVDEIVCDVVGTPCEVVIDTQVPFEVTSGVSEAFPASSFLREMKLQGYAAVPLLGTQGSLLGLFVVLFKSPIPDARFVIATLQLFSSRISAEIERAEAEERVRLALSSAADGIWDWDIETDRIFVTPDFFLRLGLTKDQLPNTMSKWESWAHPEDRGVIRDAFGRHIKDGDPFDVKCRFGIGDGKFRWVRLKGQAQRDSDDRAFRMLGSLSDIDELVKSQIAAQRANESKSLFLANMSHEIRTPMNAIMGMLQVLASSDISEDQKEWIDTANNAAVSLLTVLNDILDLSRLEAGKIDIELADVPTTGFVEDIEKAFSPLAEKKKLKFFATIDPRAPEAVATDPARLRQILSNLLSNAIKFTDEGEVELKVEVITQDDDAALRFSVRDSGVGIPEDVQKRLFHRFEQGDNSTTRKYGGTGLGLAICSELAERLGGRVGLESKRGEGSTFWFELPIEHVADRMAEQGAASEPIAEENELVRPTPDKPLAGVRALVADDNPTNQKILRLLMNAFGAEVDLVASGAEAVEKTKDAAYDIVLMDVTMPDLDGYEATKAIRALKGKAGAVPIIAVTAHAMGDELDKALSVGMNGYVSKPIEAANLIESIRTTLCLDDANEFPQGS